MWVFPNFDLRKQWGLPIAKRKVTTGASHVTNPNTVYTRKFLFQNKVHVSLKK